MKKLLLTLCFAVGAFAADYAERGTNFTGYAASTTISNQANAYVLVYDGGYSSGSRTRSMSVTNFLSLAPSGSLRANGSVVATPNLTNSTYLSVVVDGSNIYFYPTNLTAAHLATDSVSADELNATGVESELEAVLDLSDLQGAVTDAQVPNNITVDLATLATTATTANAGDSATAFFSSGEIEDARLPSSLARDAEVAAAYQPLDADLTSAAAGVTGIVKGLGNGSGYGAAVSGTDYQIPLSSISSATTTVGDGSQASQTWTFSLSGATDPAWTYANNSVSLNVPLTASSVTATILSTSGGNTTFLGELFGLYLGASRPIQWRADDGSGAPDTYLSRDAAGVVKVTSNGTALSGFKAGTLTLTPAAANTVGLTLNQGIIELSQVTGGGTPTANSGRFYAKDNAGTAELYTLDEAGNETLQTPHPDDAPANMEDRQDGLQDEFAKNVNYYLGKIEWINVTRLARFNQRLLNNTNFLNSIGETNLASLPVGRRRVYQVESFAQYNTRTGTTNPLVQLDWATVQQQHQAAYDAARALELQAYNTPLTNQLGQVSPVNTSVVVRPAADIRKPKPAWMP